jgi:hypothetical protein
MHATHWKEGANWGLAIVVSLAWVAFFTLTH